MLDTVGIEPTTFHRRAVLRTICEAKIMPLDQAPFLALLIGE